MRMYVLALGIVLAVAAGASAQPVSITTCGQTIGAGQSGVVDADLTCPTGVGTFVVAVDNGGSLDLAGHTLSGARVGVRCERRCTISSTGNAGTIMDSEPGIGAGIAAVSDGGRLTLSNLVLDNHTIALLTDFDTGKVYGTDLVLTYNGIGMQARKIRVTNLTASANYTVAQSRKTTIEDSTVVASGNSAFTGRVVVLMNSSVTGSASGIDLLTQRRPRVINSTCEVSRILQNPTETWGVCAND
jgi:hypothetical protein